MKPLVNVGVGDYAISDQAGAEIKTYGLGSCVALTVYDRRQRVGALLHVAYPEAVINPERARQQPAYFVDTGVALMMEQLSVRHRVDRHDLVLKIAGGAAMMEDEGLFNIGKRNVLAVRRELSRLGFRISAEDVGGELSRTVSLSIDTGTTLVSSGRDRWEL